MYADDNVTSGPILDTLARIASFRLTRAEARKLRCCIRCAAPIDDDWTTIDLREWDLSLLCGQCFDSIAPDEP